MHSNFFAQKLKKNSILFRYLKIMIIFATIFGTECKLFDTEFEEQL